MRDYIVMRDVLKRVATSKHELGFNDFIGIQPRDEVSRELARLMRDELIAGAVVFDATGACETCRIAGLTDEGAEFYKLIENDKVWDLVFGTLRTAGVDISYPLLKEVCEEIVKRYVISHIPKTI